MIYDDPPIPVLVHDNGGTWPVHALGWNGGQVYVEDNSGVGLKHLTWVRAGGVSRATSHPFSGRGQGDACTLA